jgi:hypothetical protein
MAAVSGLPVKMLRHSGLRMASMSLSLAAMVTLNRERVNRILMLRLLMQSWF